MIGEVRFMDMLYRAYSSPMDLIGMYINRGRFGEFVEEFLTLEAQRRKEEAEKQQHRDLWDMYIHSYTDESFNDFKKRVLRPVSTTNGKATRVNSDDELDEQGVQEIIHGLFG